jgi:hypothetical protein
MDECINKNYNQQGEVSATSVTNPKDRVLGDNTNVVHYGTSPKKNNSAGKSKDTLATGTTYSPRKRQDDLTTIGWLCSPRKQKSSPSKKLLDCISKTAYSPLGAQARRAAKLHTEYADQRMTLTYQINLAPLRTSSWYDEDADSILTKPSQLAEICGCSADYHAARIKTARGAVTTRPTEAATDNGCVRLDTSGTRQLVETVRAANS